MTPVTRLLDAARRGDPTAAAELLPLVYAELRKLAAAKLAGEKAGQTLDATALVHEAYLRLVGDQEFDGRGHFFAAAAEAMRRILVEQARRRKALKRGGGGERFELRESDRVAVTDPDTVLAVDEALTALEADDPAAGRSPACGCSPGCRSRRWRTHWGCPGRPPSATGRTPAPT